MRSEREALRPGVPPPSRGEAWLTFFKWVLGVPALVVFAAGVIWLGLWAVGGVDGLMPRTQVDMTGVLISLGVVVLLYPPMLWVWWNDLGDGLNARREWEALPPDAQARRVVAETERDAADRAAPKRGRTARKPKKDATS